MPALTPAALCVGSVKGLTCQQLEDVNCHVILGNTYHLENRPGSDLVAELGGLHNFINWKRGMLTDSGGFQVIPSSTDIPNSWTGDTKDQASVELGSLTYEHPHSFPGLVDRMSSWQC